MKGGDFQSWSTTDVRLWATTTSPEQIEAHIESFTKEGITTLVSCIQELAEQNWKEKTRALVRGLNSRPSLEAAGSEMTVSQFLDLINSTLEINGKHHWKMGPVVVGLQPRRFFRALYTANESQFHVIKHESITEPVQHHLTMMSHELAKRIAETVNTLEELEIEIEKLDMTSIGSAELTQIINRIDKHSDHFEEIFQKANRALTVVWNTNRVDLIEAFNHVKESCQKYNAYVVGKSRIDSKRPTGLYRKLEERLKEIYGNPDDLNDIEALHDGEPAIEALVKFSVWYLRDYWAIGLLPSIRGIEELDLDLRTNTEEERGDYRHRLFQEAQNNLKKIGLETVKDLKKALIFSKKSLEEYISKNRNLIQEWIKS